MDINLFIEKFAEVLNDMDASILSPETNFRELGEWSSLSALGLMAMVDEEYDVDLKGDDIRNASTIEELFGIIKEKA